jgi:hypothetical protein
MLKHAEALGIDNIPIEYIGVGEPVDAGAAVSGESKTVAMFEVDAFGVSEALSRKREARNPFHRTFPLTTPWAVLNQANASAVA